MAATSLAAQLPPAGGGGGGTDQQVDADLLPIMYRAGTDPEAFRAATWGRVFNRAAATEAEVEARAPRAVVHATRAAHVAAAVRLAGRLGCRVSVRSGGHSWAAWSVRRDAVLVDLGGMMDEEGGEHSSSPGVDNRDRNGGAVGRPIEYDARTRIVSCPPSCTGRVLNAFLASEGKGRMFAGGHCPDVGLGGFLLQGGMGWNCKNWGWACESIVGIDVVTADGRELYCSQAENEDLFWAARGAGPGFPAIATRFHLLTRPVREMYQSLYFYAISEYKTVLQWVIDVCPDADPDTEIVALSLYPPGSDEMMMMANFLTFKSSREEGEQALQRIHDSRPPGARTEMFCQTTSLAQQYEQQDHANPAGYRYCSEDAYVGNDEDVPAVLEKAFTTLPTRESFSLYFSMSPTSRRPKYAANAGDEGMALSMQSDHYFALYTVWMEAGDDTRCRGWVHDIMRAVERHAAGSYLGDADFQHRRTKFWADANAKRLMELRRRWDPEGRICGYMDEGDASGVTGLRNEFEWERPS